LNMLCNPTVHRGVLQTDYQKFNSNLLFALMLVACGVSCAGAETVTASPQAVTVSLDADLVTFVKAAVWGGAGFLAMYALIGITFFGWDVRKARGSLADAEREVKDLLGQVHSDYAKLKDLRERLEQLGAALEEEAERVPQSGYRRWLPSEIHFLNRPRGGPAAPIEGEMPAPPRSDSTLEDEPLEPQPASRSADLIREVIASGNFEWTTIGRVVKATGLTRDEVLRAVRATPDMAVTRSRQTGDFLFSMVRR
jgi:hypothetical protein